MTVYVEAFYADGIRILGNLDGQSIIKAKNYKRTKLYKMLKNNSFPALKNVDHWKICDINGRVIETIRRR